MSRVTRTTHSSAPRSPERGFALLVIFLIAAAVAFTMYQELPRAAFESARDKEQLVMDRGNQYKRAIQVFYAENKRYPAELKDLESGNNKRYLRRRYIDPLTGQDEWRLIHTNGSFLTDSLVQKPPAQNARGGLPGQGQTPGGGPLGANNMNTAAATDASNNSTDPATAAAAPALNPMAMQRPSDRRFPSGSGFPQPPGSNPGGPAVGGANAFGVNSAAYDPSDQRTWPPITIASPTGQPGQPQPPGAGAQPARGNQPFGGTPPGNQPFGGTQPGGAIQQTQIQPNFGQGGLGQANGQGGGNPQPSTLFNPNPTDPNGLAAAPVQTDPQSAPQAPGNPNAPSYGSQPSPVPQLRSPFNAGQTGVQQAANLALGGFNPQASPSAQPNPALPGNNSGNAALNAIDNALFRPNQAPATGPTGSPGIAGVASKFKGPSIKAYRERTKYQEWEFVYEPTTNQPGAPGTNQPGLSQPGSNQNGLNQTGQPGAAGQNPLQGPNPFGPSSGQPAGGAAPSNPFSMPNPFGPSSAPTR
jgi:type II secretory pathway pseudopilin PulG